MEEAMKNIKEILWFFPLKNEIELMKKKKKGKINDEKKPNVEPEIHISHSCAFLCFFFNGQKLGFPSQLQKLLYLFEIINFPSRKFCKTSVSR